MPSEATAGLSDRLRARRAFFRNGSAWMMSTGPDQDCLAAAIMIDRLRAELAAVIEAREKAERERETWRAMALRHETRADQLTAAESALRASQERCERLDAALMEAREELNRIAP